MRMFNAPAYAEDMAIGMSQMHLAHIPWHVRRRKRDIQPCSHALLVNFVDIADP